MNINELKKRIADDKMLEKMGYRKKFCEMLALAMEGDTVNWKNIARLVSVAEPVLPPKSKIVASTAALDDTAPDAPARRDFMWVIFSLVGAPGKDLTGVLAKEPMRNFYDALRTNLQAKLADYAVYRRLKNSYGAEFLELLMDVKEKWMQLEGLQYKRVTESDFDFMTAFISDADYWTDVKEAELNPAAPKAEQNAEDTQVPSAVETKLNIDISKVNASNWLTEHYNSEDYEEIDEAEGSIADTYIPEDDDNITHNPFAGSEEELDDEPVQKKEVCIDDEQPEDSGFSGLNVNEIVSYEKELAEMSEVQPEHDDIVNHTRGHKSALLGGGE